MTGQSMGLWSAAFLASLSVHLGLFIGLKPLTSGTPAKPAGVSVVLSGTLAGVLGSVPSSEAELAKAAEPVKPVTPERAKTAKPAPSPHSKVIKPVAAVLPKPAVVVAPTVAVREPTKAAIAPREIAKAYPIEALKPAQKPRAEPAKTAPHDPFSDKAELTKPRTPLKPTRRRAKKKPKTKTAARQPAGTRHQGNAGAARGGRRGTNRASSGAIASYGARVRARILANRPRATSHGRVSISFAISRSGSLRYASVSRSSGNAGLDRAALAAVRRSAPFPSPPSGASAGQLRFSIPFSFR